MLLFTPEESKAVRILEDTLEGIHNALHGKNHESLTGREQTLLEIQEAEVVKALQSWYAGEPPQFTEGKYSRDSDPGHYIPPDE